MILCWRFSKNITEWALQMWFGKPVLGEHAPNDTEIDRLLIFCLYAWPFSYYSSHQTLFGQLCLNDSPKMERRKSFLSRIVANSEEFNRWPFHCTRFLLMCMCIGTFTLSLGPPALSSSGIQIEGNRVSHYTFRDAPLISLIDRQAWIWSTAARPLL